MSCVAQAPSHWTATPYALRPKLICDSSNDHHDLTPFPLHKVSQLPAPGSELDGSSGLCSPCLQARDPVLRSQDIGTLQGDLQSDCICSNENEKPTCLCVPSYERSRIRLNDTGSCEHNQASALETPEKSS
ncbi:unnamed protein product [Protopolystoma xenopodis]|uniref:Uncharacterized protein n=1 Tax=Protopolystoma xenopodis TaxID=117903 RepID=A0A448WFK4_9PLAT|nr:unnamed protein product [Protopolystoma xenopodis]